MSTLMVEEVKVSTYRVCYNQNLCVCVWRGAPLLSVLSESAGQLTGEGHGTQPLPSCPEEREIVLQSQMSLEATQHVNGH